MLAIYILYYNFCRGHATLRVTPAMESGIVDHIRSIEEMVKLLESRSILNGVTSNSIRVSNVISSHLGAYNIMRWCCTL